MNQETTIVRNPNVITKSINDEFIILDPSKGSLYRLNETAQQIWKITRSEKSISEIISSISIKFDIQDKKSEKEIIDFIKDHIDSLFFTT